MTLSGLYFKKVLQAGKISGRLPLVLGGGSCPGIGGCFWLKAGVQWQQRPKGQRAPEPLGKSHPAWLEGRV